MSTLRLMVLSVALGCSAAMLYAQERSASLFYPSDPSFAVITYQIANTGARGERPTLRIFGDGRVTAGNADSVAKEFAIAPSEVDELVRLVVENGLLSFDSNEVRQKSVDGLLAPHRAAAAAEGTDPEKVQMMARELGASWIVTVHLAEYRAPGSTVTEHEVERIAWVRGLDRLRKSGVVAQIEELQKFNAVVEALEAVRSGTR